MEFLIKIPFQENLQKFFSWYLAFSLKTKTFLANWNSAAFYVLLAAVHDKSYSSHALRVFTFGESRSNSTGFPPLIVNGNFPYANKMSYISPQLLAVVIITTSLTSFLLSRSLRSRNLQFRVTVLSISILRAVTRDVQRARKNYYFWKTSPSVCEWVMATVNPKCSKKHL